MKNLKLLIVLTVLLFCKNDKNSYNSLITQVLGLSPQYWPAIQTIEPKKGSPQSQTVSGVNSATTVIIKGRNFSFIPSENIVTFNGISAAVNYSTDKEIWTSVPNGATTGLLSISKPGGICISLDKKSGPGCAASEFYIDCYAPYSRMYGEETLLKVGAISKITYDSFETKPFRVELLDGEHTISISCKSPVSVRRFTNTCAASEETQNGSTVLVNPQLKVTGGYTFQFFLSSTKSECSILAL